MAHSLSQAVTSKKLSSCKYQVHLDAATTGVQLKAEHERAGCNRAAIGRMPAPGAG